MLNLESIKYSLRNLRQRKGRSFLTLFSILVGIATIFIFISFGLGLYNYINELSTASSADKLIILPAGAGGLGLDEEFRLTEDDLNAIERATGVYEATPLYFTAAKAEYKNQQRYSFLVSYDPQSLLVLELFNIEIEAGRNLKKGDSRKVLLGYNYFFDNKIFEKGLEVNSIIEINDIKMTVIGFFEEIGNPADDSQMYITNDYFEELYPNKTYAEVIAKVDIVNIDRTIENVEKNLRKERGLEKGEEDFFVQSFDDLIASFSSVLNIIIGFIILIALISVIVSAINTANTMITSVLERYKEIGILKSIGGRNSSIFGIFLFESSFLGFVAGILGVLLGWSFAKIAGILLTNLGWGFLTPYFPLELFIGCVLFATLTGAISGVVPAIKASKINIVDSLRYE